jgi:hypothetical protein
MGRKTNEGKFKTSIVFERWMVDGIEAVADRMKWTFSYTVLELLRKELEFEGLTPQIGRELVKNGGEALDKASNL